MTHWEEIELALAEMDAEMERLGVEDATAWERFPEYERMLYALAEHEVIEAERKRREEFERIITAEVAERDHIIELVEMAEESALDERAAFGTAVPWFFGEPDLNEFDVWCDEKHLTADEWEAWNAATDDIPEKFFELDMSM